MTGFIERVLSVQTLNNKRGCTQRVIVVNDVAQQFDDMPTPSADTLGLIVQYTGETTADFTHGYFYEGSSSTTSSSATATQTVGSGLTDIAVDVETLETFTGWTTDNSLQIFYTDDGWSVDTTSLGVTYTGTPSVGDAITISYTAGVTTYGWQQVDVQPSGGGSSLPDQTGHSGEFLTTDGTDASWATVDGLPDQTGQSGKFLTTDGTDASWSDKPLVNNATSSGSVQILGSGTTDINCICIGTGAKSKQSSCIAIGNNSFIDGTLGAGSNIALGAGSQIYGKNQTFIGASTNDTYNSNARYCIGIGAEACTSGAVKGAIQIGKGTNSESGTVYVGQTTDGTNFTNIKLLDSDGTIPADRLASTTGLADGNYRLRLVMASGVPTLEWVAE